MTKRVNVVFTDQAYGTLDELAKKEGKTISEVIRGAIALEKWFNDTRDEGGRVLVERKGDVREIVPR